jgi:hypothetical protein
LDDRERVVDGVTPLPGGGHTEHRVPVPARVEVTKTFGKWRVKRACATGLDVLTVEAASEAASDRGFAFTCDKEGVGGMVVLKEITFSRTGLAAAVKPVLQDQGADRRVIPRRRSLPPDVQVETDLAIATGLWP